MTLSADFWFVVVVVAATVLVVVFGCDNHRRPPSATPARPATHQGGRKGEGK